VSRRTARSTAFIAALLIAALVLPGTAGAMPIDWPGNPGDVPRSAASTSPPTVVRTVVVREEAVRALPIALAAAALLVAVAGAGYVLVRVPPARGQLRPGL
jgi:hypothetical protein